MDPREWTGMLIIDSYVGWFLDSKVGWNPRKTIRLAFDSKLKGVENDGSTQHGSVLASPSTDAGIRFPSCDRSAVFETGVGDI